VLIIVLDSLEEVAADSCVREEHSAIRQQRTTKSRCCSEFPGHAAEGVAGKQNGKLRSWNRLREIKLETGVNVFLDADDFIQEVTVAGD